MNRTEFIQLIHEPDLLAARHVAALKQVVGDFPYFTVSQMLLAKALHNEKHYEYEKYLKQTALAVPDREVLYHYLHGTATAEIPAQPAAKQADAPVALPVAEKPAAEPVPEESPAAPVFTEIAAPAEPQPEQEPEPETVTEEPAAETVIPEPKEPETEAAAPLQEPEPEKESARLETAAPVLPEDDRVAAAGTSQDENDEAHSFLEWLNLKSGKQPETETAAEEPLPAQPAILAPEPVTYVKQPAEVTKADIEEAVAKSNVNDFGNILDKFIRENPSISRPKAEFFNPVNMAKQSVEEDDELVTETLANLLYKQGNLKKAIRAYEKLCLLYPSKMTYFASLIQKIKTELKD